MYDLSFLLNVFFTEQSKCTLIIYAFTGVHLQAVAWSVMLGTGYAGIAGLGWLLVPGTCSMLILYLITSII